MSKLDDISSYIREQLSKYVGCANTDDLRHDITQDVAKIINDARDKFDSAWTDGPPQVGDLVEARNYQGLILEPDDWSKSSSFQANGTISFTLMLPGNALLVLATEGRERGKIRVMSTFSGEIGWMSITNLRPFQP